MNKPTPPRYVVRPVGTTTGRRHTRWLVSGWLFSLLLAVGVTWALSRGVMQGAPDRGTGIIDPAALAAQASALQQQLADLRQDRAVDRVTMRKLQHDLAQRDQQIAGLRADLAFYSRLVAGAGRGALQVQTVQLQPVPHSPHAWNLTVTLTRNARENGEARGRVRVDVRGIGRHALKQLSWTDLAGDQPKDGMPFEFKYFQQLHATVLLPTGFTPNKLHVTVMPHGHATITQDVTWTDALKQAGETHVQP